MALEARLRSALDGACDAAVLFDFEPAVVSRAVEAGEGIIVEGAEAASDDLVAALAGVLHDRHTVIEVAGVGAVPIGAPLRHPGGIPAPPPVIVVAALHAPAEIPEGLRDIATCWCDAYTPSEADEIYQAAVDNECVQGVMKDVAAFSEAVRHLFGAPQPRDALPFLRFARRVTELMHEVDILRAFAIGAELLHGRADLLPLHRDGVENAAAAPLQYSTTSADADVAAAVRTDADGCVLRIGNAIAVERAAGRAGVGETPPLDALGVQATPSMLRSLAQICAAVVQGAPVLLTGPPGAGKTAACRCCAMLLGHRFRRINLTPEASDADVYGSVQPRHKGAEVAFGWVDGAVAHDLRKPRDGERLFICLDEVDNMSHATLQALLPLLLPSAEHLLIPHTGERIPLTRAGRRLVFVAATMNPTDTGGGRRALPPSVRRCFTTVRIKEVPPDDVRRIGLAQGRGVASEEGWA
eukprot:gene377-521_t